MNIKNYSRDLYSINRLLLNTQVSAEEESINPLHICQTELLRINLLAKKLFERF